MPALHGLKEQVMQGFTEQEKDTERSICFRKNLFRYLKPLNKNQPNTSLTYTIRKDNTVSYKQCLS